MCFYGVWEKSKRNGTPKNNETLELTQQAEPTGETEGWIFRARKPSDLFSASSRPAGQKKIRGRPLILAPTAGAGASRAITRQTPDYRLSCSWGQGSLNAPIPSQPRTMLHIDRSG